MKGKFSSTGKIPVAAFIIALFALSAVIVFAQAGGATLDMRLVTKTDSPSGLKWIAGNQGSPFMRPGLSCIDCHKSAGGPNYLVAGTVYSKLDESDDILGMDGAVVQIWDAKGKSYKLTTNKAGNYFLSLRGATLDAPAKATVYLNGKERKMMSPPKNWNCALCHTSKGANGAPGRIIAP